jgi:metal-responsive CopG/Arc/MetJ family transcriptional regulator
MAYDRDKFRRVSVDLTHDEYRKLHRVVTERLSQKSTYIRAAISEKIALDQRPPAQERKRA